MGNDLQRKDVVLTGPAANEVNHLRATVMFAAADVRIETVRDTGLFEPADTVVPASRASICGGDARRHQ